MFSGGDYHEVARWLRNFVRSHAKRERATIEAVIDDEGAREGKSYAIRLRLGARYRPGLGEPAVELDFSEVAARRGSLAWCDALAGTVRGMARELVGETEGSRRSA